MINLMDNIIQKSSYTIHIVGIGGIGMSGIAEILHNLGYKVQGSDLTINDNIKRLESCGIKVFIGHKSENVKNCNVIVISSAINNKENAEIIEARKHRIPVIKRAEMLAELMRLKFSIAISGSHGKTTTTSLIATMFDDAQLHPTVINGGIINSKGTNAYLGSGNYLIAEADESDGTFIKIPASIAVITNIDPEHLDYYQTFDNLKSAYRKFIENIPFYGFAVVCADHPVVREVISDINDREIITYAINNDNVDIKAINIRLLPDKTIYDAQLLSRAFGQNKIIKDIILPMVGVHNVLNSLASIAIGSKLGFTEKQIKEAFMGFQGVKRRFTKVGEINNITIIDDYAHHPEEIKVTLKAARSLKSNNNIIAVIQPHRYSRVDSLFADFVSSIEEADIAIITDIYAAGESPIAGINKESLIANMQTKYPQKTILPLNSQDELANIIKSLAKSGDLVLCMGAGTISKFAKELADQIKELKCQ
jgi:UDP-N-acetylmuramate--alanine ligase